MAENSKIEWTHHTFNPWIGCQKVGPGCDHCYAEAWDARGLQQREGRWGAHATRTRTSAGNWSKPKAWNKAAAGLAERPRVFCASLADVMDNHASITDQMRRDQGALIEETPNLDWMLLTKRIGNAPKFLPIMFPRGVPANVWLGCTITSREEMLRDGPKLARLDARVRFWSVEPLLGDLGEVPSDLMPDLVIVGGESGPGARPMHPDWARSLRDQCVAAGVPFFFKQWGEWAPGVFECNSDSEFYDGPTLYCDADDSVDERSRYKGIVWNPETGRPEEFWTSLPDSCFDGSEIPAARRVGKARAGRLLDGREWNQMPEFIE